MKNMHNEIETPEQMGSAQEKMYLINGSFGATDAKKILLEMLHNKIHFHNRQIQIIQEQTGGDTSHSEKRIDELFDLTEKIKAVLAEAEKKNQKVEIECPLIVRIK